MIAIQTIVFFVFAMLFMVKTILIFFYIPVLFIFGVIGIHKPLDALWAKLRKKENAREIATEDIILLVLSLLNIGCAIFIANF